MSTNRRTNTVAAAFLILVTAAAAVTPSAAAAQDMPPPPASYSEAQADTGRVVYQRTCASCHAADLTGAEGPALSGEYFAGNWNGQPVSGLLGLVQGFMPMSDPGTLDDDATVAVIAYLLSVNGVPAGTVALARDAAGPIALPRRR